MDPLPLLCVIRGKRASFYLTQEGREGDEGESIKIKRPEHSPAGRRSLRTAIDVVLYLPS